MEARDGSFNSQKEITYQNERSTEDIVYYQPPGPQLIICLACIGYHLGTPHEFRHEMDGSVRIQCNTVNQQEMRLLDNMMHDVLLTQKHIPLFSHFNQEPCREHNRCDQQNISKKEMGEEEEKGSVITPMMLVLNGHLQCPEQTLLNQQVIKLLECASRWTEVCDGIES